MGKLIGLHTAGQVVLLGHARNVQQRGYYLEFVDLIMYSMAANTRLKLILNSEPLWIPSLHEFLQENCPLQNHLPVLPDDISAGTSAATWTVILTSVSFEPTHDLRRMLHWLPAWYEGDFGSGSSSIDIDERLRIVSADQHQSREHNKTARLKSDWDEYQRASKQSLNFVHLLENLSRPEFRYTAAEVPADGNCGVWTLAGCPHERQSLASHDL